MKKLRIILIALIVMVMFVLAINTTTSYAVQRSLNRQDERPYSDDNNDEIVGNDYYQIFRTPKIYRFVKIFDTANTSKNGDPETFTNFIYCLRAGKGFGSDTESGLSDGPVTYNEIGEMHTDVTDIVNKLAGYSESSNKIDKTKTFTMSGSNGISYSVNIYNAILWIADNAYLPLDMNNYRASEYKEELLDKIGVAKANRSLITDDDIEVVQQLAFWYFANYDEQLDGVNPTLSINLKQPFTESGAIKVGTASSVELVESTRGNYLNRLYNYFIDGAIENSEKYTLNDTRTITAPSLNFDKTLDFKFAEGTVGSGAYTAYKIGPFKITGNVNKIDTNTFYLTDANGNIINRYFYLDEAMTQATRTFDIVDSDTGLAIDKLSDLQTGKEYYVYLYKIFIDNNFSDYDISEITFNLSTSYSTSNIKFLATNSNDDQPLLEIEKDKLKDGDTISTRKPKVDKFSLNLTKVNSDNEKLAGASFKLEKGTWNGSTFTATGEAEEFGPTEKVEREILKLIENEEITKDGDYKPGTYYFRITETETPTGYFGLKNPLIIKVEITETDDGFSVDAKLINSENNEVSSIENVASLTLDNNTISLIVMNEKKKFDVSLRKYIIEKNGEAVSNSRVPNIDCAPLDNETDTTANYKHRKDPLEVKAGDTVTYRIETYNEGNVKGYIYTIKDYLPQYLEFIPNSDFISYEDYEELTETTAASVTAKYVYKYDEENYILEILNYSNPFIAGGLMNNLWELDAYNGETLNRNHIDLTFKVKEDFIPEEDTYLTNVATMTYGDALVHSNRTEERDSNKGGTDKLSEQFTEPDQSKLVSEDVKAYIGDTNENKDKLLDDPNEYFVGQQDDDDFEKLVVKGIRFDLSLRKFITKVGNTEVSPSRVPQIEIHDLKNGKNTTARYVHPKNTLTLKRGDLITYTIRVYNEGNVDGKVKEITDYLPEGLELVETEDTAKYNWTAGTPITKEGKNLTPITTNFLKDSTLKAYDTTKESGDSAEWCQAKDDNTGLYYFDVQVVCKIKDGVEDNEILKNIAEITDYEGGIDKDNENKVFDDDEHKPGEEDHGYKPGEEDDDDFEKVKVVEEQFDLALRKYITAVQNSDGITKSITNKEGEANTRSLNNINKDPLVTGNTTAEYKHRKDPVLVENGDIVTYTLKVYNEGDINGSVTEIKDRLPEGLEFIEPTESTTTNTDFVKKGTSNVGEAKYEYSIEDGVLTIKPISGKEEGTVFEELTAFNKTTKELDSASIEFKCKVTAVVSKEDKVLTNIAIISGDKASGAEPDKEDRDSKPETNPNEFDKPSNSEELEGYKGKTTDKVLNLEKYYEGQQDDDDFEKLVVVGKSFDLSLRKFITTINGTELEESESRKPLLDMTPLEDDDSTTTTARYEHTKNSVIVKQGDIVKYTIRVYNEGERNGYATEITDYLPEGLGFIVGYKANVDNCWGLEEGTTSKSLKDFEDACEVTKANLKLTDFDPAEGITSLDNVQIVTGKVKIKSSLLNSKLIKAYDKTKTSKASETENWQKAMDGKGTTGLYYEDIEVACVVLAPNTYKGTLKNIAEISSAKDENGTEIKNAGDDVDSIPNTVDETKYHNSSEDHGYWPGEEDDDDFEPLKLQYFDLALRKFITAVNSAEITSRVPVLSIDEATGNIKYTHPKAEAPVEVENGNEVTYTLRIFNEGTRDGYADLVADDIPEGLVFLPENSINKEYRWVMYKRVDIKDKEDYPAEEITVIDGVRYIKTDDPAEAEVIQTDYLSKEQGELRKETPDAENPALLSGYDNSKELSVTNPDNADIKVVFKVVEPNTSDRIVINSAQITHDTDDKGREVDDNDSETNKWNDGEDDQDKEYIKVKYFDLSLYKWVTKTIVMVDGETTTTETGFKPNIGKTMNIAEMDVRENSEKEPIAVVSLDKKKLNSTTVWFAYNITVMNEGEIAGSATEITDYIPEGLEFVEEDNYAFGWENAGDGKITTRCLDGLVLQPGESATIEVIFRWINSSDNLGLKTNIAEISEDFNESGSQDIDSITDNKYDEYTEEQEDDDDFALVMLQLDTGSLPTYITLVTIVLTILAGGTLLIKKYVL